MMFNQLTAKATQNLIQRTGSFRGKHRLTKLLGIGARGAPIRSRYGVLLEAHLDDATNYFAISGYESDVVPAAVESLEKGDAFIDVGANAGLFSLLAADRIGAEGVVISFEPQPKIAEIFRRNMRLNRISNVHLFEFALGSRTAISKLSISPGHSGGARLQEDGGLSILVVNPLELLPLLQALIGTRRTLVKIDVEGAEDMVIEALTPVFESLNVSKCIVEVDSTNLHKFGASVEALYERMSKQGFEPRFGLKAAAHYDEIFNRDLPTAAYDQSRPLS
jgi:FkbM family methyltransferase